MSEDLRPCPFCGSKATLEDRIIYRDCTCMGFRPVDTERYAKWWNTRPIEDALQEERDEWKYQCKGMMDARQMLFDERDALQAKLDEYEKANWNAVQEITEVRKKLDIAVELLKEILVDNLSWFDDNWHIKSDKVALIQEALKQLEGE